MYTMIVLAVAYFSVFLRSWKIPPEISLQYDSLEQRKRVSNVRIIVVGQLVAAFKPYIRNNNMKGQS